MNFIESLHILLARCVIVSVLFCNTVFAASDLPLLGEQSSLNLQREFEIGEGLYKALQENGYVIQEPLLSRYLSDIGESLLASLDRRVREYRFYLVKDGSVNAFAAPGGFIGVNIGLIAMVRSEDELASVLAHEIAHVELMHGMQMLDKARDVSLAGMVSILAAILVSGQNAELAGALAYGGAAGSAQSMVNFTRANEYEADRVGIEILKDSDYDATRMADFMQMLQSRESSGGLANLEYIRTHPINSNRVAEIESRLMGLQRQPLNPRRFEQFRDYLAYHYPQYFPVSRDSRFALALDHSRNGRYARAEALLLELIESDRDSIWYHYTRAELLRFQKRDAEASDVYRSLLLLYPDDYAIGIRQAEVLVDLGRHREALDSLKLLAQNHGQETGLYQMLVHIYTALNDEPKKMLAEGDYHWFNGNRELAKKIYRKLLDEGRLGAGSEEIIRQRIEDKKKSP